MGAIKKLLTLYQRIQKKRQLFMNRPPKVRPKSNLWKVGFSMAKYSYKFKMNVVQEYLSGKGGVTFLSKKYDISSNTSLRKWIAAYNEFGAEGLIKKRQNQTYTLDFKLHVVELYLTTEVSYQELALQVGINNPPLISKWVNDFRIAGPDALKPKRKGRLPKMKKVKDISSDNSKQADSNLDYLKQLEEENLKLRIENAYLKELRRLRLEGIPQNKKRELSIASEETSN